MAVKILSVDNREIDLVDFEICPTLEWMQEVVGGDIEVHYDNIDGEVHQFIMNEDGKTIGLKPNKKATKMLSFLNDVIVGNVIVLTGNNLMQ